MAPTPRIPPELTKVLDTPAAVVSVVRRALASPTLLKISP